MRKSKNGRWGALLAAYSLVLVVSLLSNGRTERSRRT